MIRSHLQLLLLVGSDDLKLAVDHGGLAQVQGVGGHQRERGGGPSHPPVHAHGVGAVAGRWHGAQPRRAPRRGAAHAGRREGGAGGVPENLPVGRRRVAVPEAHSGSESDRN